MRERHLQLLAAFVLVGAILRFATLDARSFWLDEVYTSTLLGRDLGGLLSGLFRTRTGSAPLYFLLAWPWAKAFGTGEVGLRSLPALFGTATIPVAYAAASELASRRAGLIAAALTAVSPLVVWHSQDARPYALLILLGGLSFVFFLRALRIGDRRALVVWAIASALAIVTHYYAVFLVAAEAAVLALRLRPHRRRQVVWAVAGLVAAGVVFAGLAGSADILGRGQVGGSLSSRSVQLPAQFLVGYQPPFQLAASAVTALVALAAVWLLLRRGDNAERRAAGLAAVIGGVAVVAPLLFAVIGFDYVLSRHLTGAWIAVAAVAAVGFGARGAGRAGTIGAATLCALFLAIVLGSAWEPKFDRDDWRGASAAIGPPRWGRAIVVFPRLGGRAFAYYRPGAVRDQRTGAWVQEIDLLGMAEPYRKIGEKPVPVRPAVVRRPAPGFVFAGRRNAEHFTIVRFRSSVPRAIWLPSLRAASLAGAAAVVLDRPGR